MIRPDVSGGRLAARLAARAAHDLNNVAAVLTGHLYLLAEAAESPAEAAEAMEKALAHLGRLTHSLAAVGVLGSEPAGEVDLGEIAVEAARSSAPPVDMDIEKGLPACRGRRGDLLRALEALIANASEASTGGQRVRGFVRREGSAVLVTIEDGGVGVPAEVRRRNFEPLFSTKGQQGRGIGVTIAAAVAEEHGGTLAIESIHEGGTRATLTIACADGERGISPAR